MDVLARQIIDHMTKKYTVEMNMNRTVLPCCMVHTVWAIQYFIKSISYRLYGTDNIVQMLDDLFCPTRTRMTLRNLQDINLTSLIDKCFQKNDIKSRLGHVRTRPIDRLQTLIKFDSMSDCLKIDLYFKRRTGLMAEDVDADALKKSLKRSKKVKSQDTMSIESWKSTSSRGKNFIMYNYKFMIDKKFRDSNRRKNPIRHSKRGNRGSQIN